MGKQDKINAIIHEISGTTLSLGDVAEKYGLSDLDDDLCASVDKSIFQCAECSWWCEMHEEVSEFAGLSEWTCRDCAETNHGYDGDD